MIESELRESTQLNAVSEVDWENLVVEECMRLSTPNLKPQQRGPQLAKPSSQVTRLRT